MVSCNVDHFKVYGCSTNGGRLTVGMSKYYRMRNIILKIFSLGSGLTD